MRVAAIYDIHGNIDALDAVLKEVETEHVDLVIIGGDVAWGPFPAEVLALIRELDQPAEVILGNADRELAARATEADGLEDWVAEVNNWCTDQLSSDEREFLAASPEAVIVPIESIGEVLFCRGTPRSDEEIATEITPNEDLAPVLAKVTQEVVVCGHTHSQFDRVADDHRIVNAGSVGLPYEDAPGAYWAILGPDVTLKQTEYDFLGAAAHVRESQCLHVEGFVDALTSPLSRSAATETFEIRRSEVSTLNSCRPEVAPRSDRPRAGLYKCHVQTMAVPLEGASVEECSSTKARRSEEDHALVAGMVQLACRSTNRKRRPRTPLREKRSRPLL